MQNLENINVTEVLDRVLDHGIVMDPSTRVFLLGVDLHTFKGRFVVESVQTPMNRSAQ
ncbi:MAG: gas vesicle protein GvpJ [Candidatus Angelobacter sp.]